MLERSTRHVPKNLRALQHPDPSARAERPSLAPQLRMLRESSELAAVEDERSPVAMDDGGMELEQHNDVIACLQLLADRAVILGDPLGEHHRITLGNLEGDACE